MRKGYEIPEMMTETQLKNIFEIDSEEMKSYYDNKDRELMDKYKKKKEFKDSLAAFEKIAKKAVLAVSSSDREGI